MSRSSPIAPPSRRHKTFDATHRTLIEASVRLISEKGVEALSVAALARAVGMNRATVYYHFADREQLLEAVSDWSSKQLTRGFGDSGSQNERIDFVARFVIENADLMKLWIDQYIAPGNIRDHYPKWDEFLAAMQHDRPQDPAGEEPDFEVLAAILLTGSIIGPRVFRNSIRPDLREQEIVDRFRRELQRIYRRDNLFGE